MTCCGKYKNQAAAMAKLSYRNRGRSALECDNRRKCGLMRAAGFSEGADFTGRGDGFSTDVNQIGKLAKPMATISANAIEVRSMSLLYFG